MEDMPDARPGTQYYPNNNQGFLPVDSWRILRIMAEFVDSFESLNHLPELSVSVFGSARTPEGSPVYESARETGRLLVEAGYGVITGGGPGVMEAAARGAFEAGGRSIGLNIELPGTKLGSITVLQSMGDTPESEISICSYEGEPINVEELINYYISDK